MWYSQLPTGTHPFDSAVIEYNKYLLGAKKGDEGKADGCPHSADAKWNWRCLSLKFRLNSEDVKQPLPLPGFIFLVQRGHGVKHNRPYLNLVGHTLEAIILKGENPAG